MRNFIFAEELKVGFVTCEKELSYFLKQNLIILLVQFPQATLRLWKQKNFRLDSLVLYLFVSICLSSCLLKSLKQFSYVKTNSNFFKTINRSIPVIFRFADLLISKLKVLTEAMSWFILWCARQILWMLEEWSHAPFYRISSSSQQGELRVLFI